MTIESVLGVVGALFAIAGVIAASILYVRNESSKIATACDEKINRLSLSFDNQLARERDYSNRVYAQHADMTRLEARMESIDSTLADVRELVHAIYKRSNV